MSFLQPWLLLALPLALIPIIIHLVNQWRYQTKPWAAMMFLMAAKSMHRGFAKLRQWLILAMRVLAVAGLIFAVSRPLTTGVMGLIAGGRIDTTIVMLDRSPSMLEQSDASRESKLETSLRQLHETLATQPSQRWVLIDSARPTPQEFSSLEALIDAPLAGGTSTIAAWPLMFQSALDYIQSNRPSQTNVWISSDLRHGDWQAQRGPWPAIREAFQSLATPVRFFALTYPAVSPSNRSLTVEQVRLENQDDRRAVVMTIRVKRATATDANEIVPIQLSLGGGRSEVEIELVNGLGELKDFRIPIDRSVSLGWGKASIPSDDNPADNEQYFAFDVTPPRQTILFCEHPDRVFPIRIATEISKDPQSPAAVKVVTLDAAAQTSVDEASLIVWQGPLPQGEIALRLEEHVDRGRAIWFLPPFAMVDQGAPSEPDVAFRSFRWLAWRQPPTPLKPTTWRTDEGILASTMSGMALPVGEVNVAGYATFEGDVTPLATLEGGPPLLAKLNLPRGHVYVCSTFPIEPISNMAKNGVALFVALQRALEQASLLMGNAIAYPATPILPSAKVAATESSSSESPSTAAIRALNLTPPETWQPVATDDRFLSSETGLHSGVFESGNKLVAVNRPSEEDSADSLSGDQLSQLLKGLDLVRIEDTAGSTKKIQQEIWRVFLILMIFALLLEALFSLPRKQTGNERRMDPASPFPSAS